MKKSKIIIMLLVFFTILANLNNVVMAGQTEGTDAGGGGSTYNPVTDPDMYKPQELSNEPELQEKAETILGAINVIGVIVSVITLMIIGIKYMVGSIEEKAEYKKTATIYLIGAILVFSVTTIPNILFKIGTTIKGL